MWGRSGMHRNAVNRKPDSVTINVALRKVKQIESEEGDENKSKYKLTPRSSLRITSNYIRNTVKNLSKDSNNIFIYPKSSRKVAKVNNPQVINSRTDTGNGLNNLKKPCRLERKVHEKKAHQSNIKRSDAENKRQTMVKKNNEVDLERMFRLGLALDWNPNTTVEFNDHKNRKEIRGGSKTPTATANTAEIGSGNLTEELGYTKQNNEKYSEESQFMAKKLKTVTLENGWIDYGNQKSSLLPHRFMCPFDDSAEDKRGKIDGLVTLEELMDYASATKEKIQTPVTSQRRDIYKNCGQTNEEYLLEDGAREVQPRYEDTANDILGIEESKHSEKSRIWMEKANRWASGANENLNNLTEEEKLTKAWTESLARWEAEKQDLLEEASNNHYALGKRSGYSQTYNPYKSNKPNISTASISKQNRTNPHQMSKRDVKAFCFYWDQGNEGDRNALMVKFLKLYSSGLEDSLDVDEIFAGGANLLFMRFVFGFKVSFIKKYRCWRYIECILVFLQSLENTIFAQQLLEVNILEDVLELIRYHDSHSFDKLESLYFLSILLEGSIGQEIIERISCSGKLMDLLLQFFINCEEPQTLVVCRNVLVTITTRTALNTSEVMLESISHLVMSEQTPLKVELIFQIIKCFLSQHPPIICKCGSLILDNLNTNDINIMLGIGELAVTILEHPECLEVVKAIFEKALSPFADVYYNEFKQSIGNYLQKIGTPFEHFMNSPSRRFPDGRKNAFSNKDSNADIDQQQVDQFAAFFVVNYILENQGSSKILTEFGVVGLSLIAAGHSFSNTIQQEGVRLMNNLHQLNFECAASYTLLLSDEILSNILTKRIDCLNEVPSDALLHLRQLGYLILENWELWISQVVLPTKMELTEDFEATMSKEEDYTVDPNYARSRENNKCQKIVSEKFKTPLGKQIAEIREKLKSSWMRRDGDGNTDLYSVSKYGGECGDGDDNTSCSAESSNLYWATYDDYHSESEPEANLNSENYFKRPSAPIRENNESYIEEIDDTDGDYESVSQFSYSNGTGEAATEVRKETSNFPDTIDEYPPNSTAVTGTEMDNCRDGKDEAGNNSSDVLLLATKASLMRKIIQRYQ